MGHFPAPYTVSWGPSLGCIQLVAKVGWKVPEGFTHTSVLLHVSSWANVGFLTARWAQGSRVSYMKIGFQEQKRDWPALLKAKPETTQGHSTTVSRTKQLTKPALIQGGDKIAAAFKGKSSMCPQEGRNYGSQLWRKPRCSHYSVNWFAILHSRHSCISCTQPHAVGRVRCPRCCGNCSMSVATG